MSKSNVKDNSPTVELSLAKIIEESKGNSLVIPDFNSVKTELEKVKKKYQSLGKKELTKENLQEFKDARADIRSYRYGMQNILKNNKDILNSKKKEMEDDTEKLISIIMPIEESIDKKIKDEETRIQKEKEEKAKKEQERIDKIMNKISEFNDAIRSLVAIGKTEEDRNKLVQIKTELTKLMEDEFFEEFNWQAEDVENDIEAGIDAITLRIKEHQELEKQKQEQAEKEKKLKEEQEKIKNERISARLEIVDMLGFVAEDESVPLDQRQFVHTFEHIGPVHIYGGFIIEHSAEEWKSYLDSVKKELEQSKRLSDAWPEKLKWLHDNGWTQEDSLFKKKGYDNMIDIQVMLADDIEAEALGRKLPEPIPVKNVIKIEANDVKDETPKIDHEDIKNMTDLCFSLKISLNKVNAPSEIISKLDDINAFVSGLMQK